MAQSGHTSQMIWIFGGQMCLSMVRIDQRKYVLRKKVYPSGPVPSQDSPTVLICICIAHSLFIYMTKQRPRACGVNSQTSQACKTAKN